MHKHYNSCHYSLAVAALAIQRRVAKIVRQHPKKYRADLMTKSAPMISIKSTPQQSGAGNRTSLLYMYYSS